MNEKSFRPTPAMVELLDKHSTEGAGVRLDNSQTGVRLNSCDTNLSDGGSTPKVYGLPSGAVDLQDLIEFRDMNFAVGNIFKAAYRLGVGKNSPEYELRKIIWFAERELARHALRTKLGRSDSQEDL